MGQKHVEAHAHSQFGDLTSLRSFLLRLGRRPKGAGVCEQTNTV